MNNKQKKNDIRAMLTSGNYTVYEVAEAWDMTVEEMKELLITPKQPKQPLTKKVAVSPRDPAKPPRTKKKRRREQAPSIVLLPKKLKPAVQILIEFPAVHGSGQAHLHVRDIPAPKYTPYYPAKKDIDLTTGWSEWELQELRIRDTGVIMPK